jgi:biotin carboxyl carrier protein
MKEIHGEIEGKQIIVKHLSQVAEQTQNHFTVIMNDKVTEIFLDSSGLFSDGNSLNGIEVKITTKGERLISEHFAKNQTNGNLKVGAKGMILKAPMPGMVRTVLVSIGDIVQKNTPVLVLEAMKMENTINAGFNGITSKIHVEVGVSVEKSMPLIEFELKQ